MTLPWYLSAAGLYLATAAAWFMYRYPLAVVGAEAAPVSARHRRCARLGVGLLGAGVFLQFLGVRLSAVR